MVRGGKFIITIKVNKVIIKYVDDRAVLALRVGKLIHDKKKYLFQGGHITIPSMPKEF